MALPGPALTPHKQEVDGRRWGHLGKARRGWGWLVTTPRQTVSRKGLLGHMQKMVGRQMKGQLQA